MPDVARTLLLGFARRFRDVGRELAVAPSRLRPLEAAAGLGIAGVVVATYLEKQPLQAALQRPSPVVLPALVFANLAGSGFTVAAAGAIVLVVGLSRRSPAWADALLTLAAAGLWCWLLTRLGQLVLAERRPAEGGQMRWLALDGHGVSGHAAAAALLVRPVRDVLVRPPGGLARALLTGALVAWAVFIGWSRVALGMHHVWNVVLGFALGGSVGAVGARMARQRLGPQGIVSRRARS